MAKIQYTNKVNLNTNPEIPAENKVSANDMNEIKESVNALYDEVDTKLDADQVVNTQSNSQTDTYSCDYINEALDDKLQAYTLYENASGTTGAVTLSDGRNNYDFLIVTYLNGNNSYSAIIDKSANYVQLGGTYSNMGYGVIAFFGKLYNLSNTALSPNTYAVYGEMQVNLSSMTLTPATTDTLKITKVVGYK